MRFAGDALTGGYVDAGNNSGADIYADISKKAPDYGALSNIGMEEQAKQRISAINSSAKVSGAGIQSLGNAVAGMNGAQADISAANSAASATRQNGMMSMFGDIGGAAVSKFGNLGKWSDATDIGFKGNQVDANGRLRY